MKPMDLLMDDPGVLPHPRSSGLRVSTKSRAPSPPGIKKLDSPGLSQWFPGSPPLTMDQKENLVDKELSLVVVLPGGEEKTTSVHGSKPLMDLLVTLCAKYRLNPSSHTLELVTANKKSTKLKPNALIGTLEAEKIILKAKGEEKNKKTGPQMPEATVRMVINYNKTQKTILRVNPRVPLAEHLAAICEKCEFDAESTVLLKDVHSLAPLDLSCSLNDYAIREVYARDTGRRPSTPVSPVSPSHAGNVVPGKDKTQKEEENKGLFSKFRKSKKKSEQAATASAPASPVLVSRPRPLSMALPSSGSSALGSATFADGPKKRRAPLPPVLVSQSRSAELSPRRRINSEPNTHLDGEQLAGLSRGSSAESSLKRTKRKAPPPPASPSAALQQAVPVDEKSPEAKTLEEIMEQEETTASAKSAAASDDQGEDGDAASTQVSLPSPESMAAAAAAAAAAVVPETNGEHHSHDLSSAGDQTQSPATGSAAVSDVSATEATSEHSEMNGGSSPPDAESLSPPSEDSAPEAAGEQEVETRCSVETETDDVRTADVKITEVPDVLHANAEDAQVQTDVLPPPPPSPPPPSPPPALSEEAVLTVPDALTVAEKKDMATSTEELGSPDLANIPPQTSETSSCQDGEPSVPVSAAAPSAEVPTAAPSVYATDSDPKPKPSNELTRDYIPKVGMTTYTIVPQKSLEKLRYFEVALTLERPAGAGEEQEGAGLDALTAPLSGVGAAPREQAAASEGKGEVVSAAPGEDVPTSAAAAAAAGAAATAAAAPPTQRAANGNESPTAAAAAASPAQVKAAKIPPATKPKPGSFRLAQHKKPPGYYVTSAAEKHLQREVGSEELPLPPPPAPPPASPPAAAAAAAAPPVTDCNVETNPKVGGGGGGSDPAPLRFPRQSSLPSRTPVPALSLEKLRSFATPRPFTPSSPSRFAQAVSSAVKRSQSISHEPKSGSCSPVRAPLSPISSHPPAADPKGLQKLKDGESAETGGAESSTSMEKGEGPCLSGAGVLIEGQSGP
ncbi:cordon-bleu protein-like 1b isoform X2 [Nelusetta ayraudi]|uniref:cordon-bleu protein-like 1b isoform X2 n=1 Tax=Nelusetta ayraudi TaxID=303726 RepID=UPI003F71542E